MVGGGFIGEIHARAIRAAGGTLATLVDATLESAEASARRLGAERATADFDDALRDDVDVVHICTPNHLHAPLAEKALSAGKHVVCEKPLATTVDDAARLVDLAALTGAVTAVPFVYRYYPMVLEARRRIADGETGALRLMHGSYLQDWLSSAADQNWRTNATLGGASRTFADIGVHWCDLMEFVTGHRIVRVSANLISPVDRPGQQTEDAATVMFETDGGAAGSMTASQITPGRKNRLWFSFDGATQSVAFDQEQPETLWVGARDRIELAIRGVGASGDVAVETVLPSGHPQGYQDCFNGLIRDTYARVSGITSDRLPTFSDGLRAATLTDAVLTSQRERTWVEVPS